MKRQKQLDRIDFLKETHRVLDAEIENAIKHNYQDWMVKDMKKRKLELKDQIEQMEKDVKKDVPSTT